MPATVEGIGHCVKNNSGVLSIGADRTVVEAARKMRDNRVGCLVVLDERGRAAGILTERDIADKVVADGLDPAQVPVHEIMTRRIISCTPNTPVVKAQHIMALHDIRHLPIIENDVLLGMLSSRDVLAHQFSTVKAIVHQQTQILHELEDLYPGITQIEKDRSGRVVI
jgi:CBS domain-containing protein